MNYYESFKFYWVPIYKVQVAKAKAEDNSKALSSIRNSVRNNIHLTPKEKDNILRLIGILPKVRLNSWSE